MSKVTYKFRGPDAERMSAAAMEPAQAPLLVREILRSIDALSDLELSRKTRVHKGDNTWVIYIDRDTDDEWVIEGWVNRG